MNNNRLLKIYLLTACTSTLLFLASFAISWHTADSMADLYGATLPFLFVVVASLTAFGFSPSVKEVQPVKSHSAKNNVVQLKAYTLNRHSKPALRKIS